MVYTYDSLAAPGGLGAAVVPKFEKRCGCRVRLVASGDAGQLLARLGLDHERHKPVAQVVWGIDQQLWTQARRFGEPWGTWKPARLERVRPELRVGAPGEGFLPFDYGVLALMADTVQLKQLGIARPAALRDLLKPEFRRRLLLEDPRTSSPGLGFLLFTRQVLGAGEKSWNFWRELKGHWLAMPAGWDQAYGAFLKGEAPLVWSYLSSQAYHREKDAASGDRYQAVLFAEGQPVQVEGAILVRASLDARPELRPLARQFLEYLLSDEVQAEVALKNWMHPVISGTALPASFRSLPKPARLLRLETGSARAAQDLDDWFRVIQ